MQNDFKARDGQRVTQQMQSLDSIEAPRFEYAERSILSTIFNNDSFDSTSYLPKIFSKLSEDHFQSPLNKNLFNYLRDLDKIGEKVDFTQLATDAYIDPLKFGNTADLAQIQSHDPAFQESQLNQYIEILVLGKTKRTMLDQSIRLQAAAISGNSDEVKTLLPSIEKELAEMAAETSLSGEIGSPKKILKKIIENMESTQKSISGLSYGSKQIDQLTDGMQQGVSVFCGLPSEGKSVLMMMACANAILDKKNIIIFELDMPDVDVLTRLACFISGCDVSLFKKGANRTIGENKSINKAFATLAGSENLEIYDTIFNVEEMEAKIEDFKRRRGSVDLIVVDYWQLIETFEKLDETRTMNKTSKALKAITQKHKCPLVTGAQINENGDTKDSKQIQADAVFQAVIQQTKEDTMLYIKKNRGGRKNVSLPQRMNGLKQKFERYYSQNLIDAWQAGKVTLPSDAVQGGTVIEGWRYDPMENRYSDRY